MQIKFTDSSSNEELIANTKLCNCSKPPSHIKRDIKERLMAREINAAGEIVIFERDILKMTLF